MKGQIPMLIPLLVGALYWNSELPGENARYNSQTGRQDPRSDIGLVRIR